MNYVNTGTGQIGLSTLYFYQHAGSGNPTPIVPVPEVTAGRVVGGGKRELIIQHGLLTSAILPAFTPSWNTMVYPTWITSEILRVGFNTPAPDKGATLDFVISRGTRAAVTEGDTSYTITHSLSSDTDVSGDIELEDGGGILLEDGGALEQESVTAGPVILVSTSWNTTLYRTAKSASSMTVGFNTPAPAGAYIYWSRHLADSDLTGTKNLTAGDRSATIMHNGGRPFLPIFVLPSWNTQCRFASKIEENSTVVSFNVPAPSGAELDWKVKYLAGTTNIR